MALKLFSKKKQPDGFEDFRKPDEAQPEASHDESNWLISYADMMTLLCGFFIMLFSMAKLDEAQYESVKEAVAKHFGGDYKSPSADLAKFVTQILNETGIEGVASLKSDAAGVSIIFKSTVFFDTLSSELTFEGRRILEKLIDGISGRQKAELRDYRIVVEGHTDSRPILSGIYPSNWELSGARASRVVRSFLEKGFAPKMLTPIGFADTRPENPSRTPAGEWDEAALTKNRRVIIRVLDPRIQEISAY